MKTLPIIPLLAAWLGLSLAAFAQETKVRIAVRSEVDRPFQGWGKAPLKEHGKVYYIMSIKLGDPGKGTVRPMVRPVDEALLRKVLVAQLARQGFRPMAGNEKPDILLTVIYGRGFLENPYMEGGVVDENGVINISAADANQHVEKARSGLYQAKLQNARLEKLFIRVTAWAYPDPAQGRQKPKELWKTTVLIDEPAHRDLNQFIEKMLAAAAGYFDHPTKEEEAFVDTPLPVGYVRLGDTKVVPDKPGDNEPRK